MTLIPLPAFADNYLWLLHDGKDALVVDPGDAQPVLRALDAAHLSLKGILITHHHADHTGGVGELRSATGAQVFGRHRESMPEPLKRVGAGDTVQMLGLSFDVLEVPGHTAGHIAYYCAQADIAAAATTSSTAPTAPLLFCGDTLFSGGCGRLFEGTPAQMQASLAQFAALPGDTRVCCTHEYTLANLKFALQVEPDNADLAAYQAQCLALREAQSPTLPSSIQRELAINPFLRTTSPQILASLNRFDAVGVQTDGAFATLRR